jgi:hypothetical protein
MVSKKKAAKKKAKSKIFTIPVRCTCAGRVFLFGEKCD